VKQRKMAWAAGLAAILLASAGAASADCKLAEIAEFHLDPHSTLPTVDGQLNGQPVKILLDTGATRSMIPYPEAKRLNLPTKFLRGVRMHGVGGDTAAYDANVQTLTIAGFTTHNRSLLVAGSPDARYGFSLLLGDDFFSQADVEFDLRNGVVRLFDPHGCSPPQLVYWGENYSQAALLESERDDPRTEIKAMIDGKQVLAEFDSGASASFIDQAAAEGAGASRATGEPGHAARGMGARRQPTWIAHFDNLALGDEKLSNIHLQVIAAGPLAWSTSQTGTLIAPRLESTPAMWLGDDFFRAHRVFIDNEDRLILFSYEGGPVFASAPAPASASPGH
jgi:predicted aspartyl protease